MLFKSQFNKNNWEDTENKCNIKCLKHEWKKKYAFFSKDLKRPKLIESHMTFINKKTQYCKNINSL